MKSIKIHTKPIEPSITVISPLDTKLTPYLPAWMQHDDIHMIPFFSSDHKTPKATSLTLLYAPSIWKIWALAINHNTDPTITAIVCNTQPVQPLFLRQRLLYERYKRGSDTKSALIDHFLHTQGLPRDTSSLTNGDWLKFLDSALENRHSPHLTMREDESYDQLVLRLQPLLKDML